MTRLFEYEAFEANRPPPVRRMSRPSDDSRSTPAPAVGPPVPLAAVRSAAMNGALTREERQQVDEVRSGALAPRHPDGIPTFLETVRQMAE